MSDFKKTVELWNNNYPAATLNSRELSIAYSFYCAGITNTQLKYTSVMGDTLQEATNEHHSLQIDL